MRREIALSAIALAFVGAVYLPDVGRGFVKDDFDWIASSRDGLHHPMAIILPGSVGFYRPLVSLTFALDAALHGLNSRGYGLTNLALYLLCGAALVYLGRAAGMTRRADVLAAFIWMVNPHGVNMALLWISGRTALCLALFTPLAVASFVRRRYVWSALFLAGALGSKEEAVSLPAIMWAWRLLLGDDSAWRCRVDGTVSSRLRVLVAPLAASLVPLAAYALLRSRTTAWTPATAPDFYRFTFQPAVVGRNLLEYLDRAGMCALLVAGLGWIVYRSRPAFGRRDRRLFWACGVWFAASLMVTVFLPVRSSLYAILPSMAAALAAALIVDRMREAAMQAASPATPPRGGDAALEGSLEPVPRRTEDVRWLTRRSLLLQRVGLEPALAAVLLLIPIYRIRDARYTGPARLSHRALSVIVPVARTIQAGDVIVLEDAREAARENAKDDGSDPRASFVGAFGGAGSEALRLWTGRDVRVRIDAADAEVSASPLAEPARATARFRIRDGEVVRIDDGH